MNTPPKTANWFKFQLLSYKPLVSYSSLSFNQVNLVDLAKQMPEVFDQKIGLHFLATTWHCENGIARSVVQAVKQAEAALPGHVFVVLSGSETDTLLLSEAGVRTVTANSGIFINERICNVSDAREPGVGQFDAVYNARFATLKRHYLAKKVESLMLIYSHAGIEEEENELVVEKAKQMFPTAFFANRELHPGAHQHLSPAMVARLLGHAKTGLILSAQEGACRASMEYLLCGLPVVSTESIGGRERYYGAPYAKVVKGDPDAVAQGVRTMVQANLDRAAIRRHIGEIIGFERHVFLLCVNNAVKHYLGVPELFKNFEAFRRINQRESQTSLFVAQLQRIAGNKAGFDVQGELLQ